MPLPRSAADALASPRDELVLELHMIAFSHYCARAKWYLGACGIGLEAVRPLLPVQHVPHMVALLKKFNAPRAKPTASSNSPAATPALAVYRRDNSSSTKTPLFLLQDSELIGRWAALRAQALGDGGAAARTLYGPGAKLSVVIEEKEEEEVAADGTTTTKKREVAMAALDYDQSKANTANPTPAELERRLSGALGVESRRLVYFYLLPARSLLMRLCALNTPAGSGFFTTRVTAPLWALAASFALPGLLGINAANVEKGLKKLDAEFEYLDALIEQRGCLVAGESQGEERVGAFLCGGGDKKSTTGGPSAADVSLAALAAPLAGDGVEGYGAYLPSESELPEAFRQVLRERYIDRPTARYARALWREHGAAAVAKAAGGSAPSAAAAPKL
jgi:hypothetical protein